MLSISLDGHHAPDEGMNSLSSAGHSLVFLVFAIYQMQKHCELTAWKVCPFEVR